MSEFVRLGDHITIAKGKPPAELPFDGPGASPYLTPEYLRGRAFAVSAKPGLDAVAVADGDAVLLWDGSNAGEFFLGKSGLAASTMARVRADESIQRGYLVHAMKHLEPRLKSQTNGTGIPHVDREVLEGFLVFRPAVLEQAQIAKILDTLDTTVRQTESIIEKLKQVKQGLLHDLLTRGIDANGELRPPQSQAPHLYKESPLGWIPRGWDIELLDDVAVRGSGHTPSKSVASYWNGGVQWVSLADSHRLDQIHIDATDKEISDLGIANSSAVKHAAGTVVLSRDAGVGKSAVLGSEMAVSQHFMAWRCSERLNNLFLYCKLQHMKPTFEAIALGSTVKTIGLDYFKKLRIPVPARPEQDKAAEIMMAAEADVYRERVELEKLRLLKSGLMDDLLTGRVRVTPLLA
jgi:type I restriction enzyme S subunit